MNATKTKGRTGEAVTAKRKKHNYNTKPMTQKQIVLRDLKKNTRKGVTSMDMFSKYAITRLSGHIYELRKEGHIIDTVMVEGKNGNMFGRYLYRGISEEEK